MDINELVESVKLSDYVGQYCDLIYKDGEYWCLSPFSGVDTDPSFSIRDEEHVYYDFSAGHGGNIISFVQRYHKVGLSRAIDMICEWAGIADDVVSSSASEANAVMRRFSPKNTEKAAENHIILSPDIMLRYEVDEDILQPWIDEGIDLDTMRHFDVRYDRRNQRIVFPVRDNDGNIISISGRTVDPLYKEKGLRKYTYYHKLGTIDFLYGFSQAREHILAAKELILFEGAKSTYKCWSAGIKNVAASLTSHLNEHQMRFLMKLGVGVTLSYDKGIDVRKDKNARKLAQFVPVWYIYDRDGLLDDKDAPVDKGMDVFKQLLSERRLL